jgi:uncharacterized protein
VSSLVAAETSWMLLSRFGTTAQATFLRMIVTGTVTVIDLTVEDWRRVGELCDVYASHQLDAVDASLIAIAERLDLTDIATFNGRDFYTIRPRHTTGFTSVLTATHLQSPPRRKHASARPHQRHSRRTTSQRPADGSFTCTRTPTSITGGYDSVGCHYFLKNRLEPTSPCTGSRRSFTYEGVLHE